MRTRIILRKHLAGNPWQKFALISTRMTHCENPILTQANTHCGLLLAAYVYRQSSVSRNAVRPSSSGSSSITCVTGSWCGASRTRGTGRWPTSMRTCSARRTPGPRWVTVVLLFSKAINCLFHRNENSEMLTTLCHLRNVLNPGCNFLPRSFSMCICGAKAGLCCTGVEACALCRRLGSFQLEKVCKVTINYDYYLVLFDTSLSPSGTFTEKQKQARSQKQISRCLALLGVLKVMWMCDEFSSITLLA